MSEFDTETVDRLNRYTDNLQKKYVNTLAKNFELKNKLKHLENVYHLRKTDNTTDNLNDITDMTDMTKMTDITEMTYMTDMTEKDNNKLQDFKDKKGDMTDMTYMTDMIEKDNNKLQDFKDNIYKKGDMKFNKSLSEFPNDKFIKNIDRDYFISEIPDNKLVKGHNNRMKHNMDNIIRTVDKLVDILDTDKYNDKDVLKIEIDDNYKDKIEKFKKEHISEDVVILRNPVIDALQWLDK